MTLACLQETGRVAQPVGSTCAGGVVLDASPSSGFKHTKRGRSRPLMPTGDGLKFLMQTQPLWFALGSAFEGHFSHSVLPGFASSSTTWITSSALGHWVAHWRGVRSNLPDSVRKGLDTSSTVPAGQTQELLSSTHIYTSLGCISPIQQCEQLRFCQNRQQ